MTRWRGILLSISAALLMCIGIVLVKVGSDHRAVLSSSYARLAELRKQRLDPREVERAKKILAGGHEPRSGLLIASPASATTKLEAYIRSIAQQQNAEIQSLSFTTDPTDRYVPSVYTNLHLVIRDDTIGVFLKTLESGLPAVFVERLSIAYRPTEDAAYDALLLDVTISLLVYRGDPPPEGRTP